MTPRELIPTSILIQTSTLIIRYFSSLVCVTATALVIKIICISYQSSLFLNNTKKQEFAITAMILSAQFWPHFNKETLELPEFVQEHLNTYTKAFETQKVCCNINFVFGFCFLNYFISFFREIEL